MTPGFTADAADAVVIGAGPNGLVAANLLADAGCDVLVLEAAAEPGGAVRSSALIEPGFVNDVCSAFYPFAAVGPIARLGLEDFGLRWTHAPIVLAHPAGDGTCPTLSRDCDGTAAGLAGAHPADGRAWIALHESWTQVRGPLLRAMLGPFPPVRASVRLAAALRRDLARFLRFLLLPARRMAEETFTSPQARRLLVGCALHADFGPEMAGGGTFGWLLLMLGQDHGFPVPAGGAGQITAALVRRLESRGGRVICGQPVERVTVRDGRAIGVETGTGRFRARRAVLADVDAPRLFHRLVGDDLLPPRFVDDLRRFQWDHATFKVDWNLDAPVPWTAEAARRAGTVHIADSVDDLTRHTAEITQGLLPSRPFLLAGQQSITDPSRQPPGAETLWAYTHVPHAARADASGGADAIDVTSRCWGERFADRIEAEIERLAPGFRSSIRARHVATPADLEAHDANLVGGAVSGGTSQPHQMLMFRPVPGGGRPETPIDGLYLASASAHPGGAVHGAPGANAARAALWHARVNRITRRAT